MSFYEIFNNYSIITTRNKNNLKTFSPFTFCNDNFHFRNEHSYPEVTLQLKVSGASNGNLISKLRSSSI